MPWQMDVANVAFEVDPATGGLWYREIILTVPRQSGKTTLLLPKFVFRAEAAHLLGGRQRMLYAAQTKNDAFDKFDEDYLEDLAAARVMRGRYRVTNNQGRKRIRFKSGSLLMPVATTPRGGHGKTLDDGTLDEAWAQVDNRVEAAWRPAMITRPSPQLWTVSTAGGVGSTYFRNKVLRGRAIVDRGDPNSRLAHFEWSIPEGEDTADPALWWRHMPALGYTIGEAAIRHEFETMEGGRSEFDRAYGNVWPDGLGIPVWPVESWAHCEDGASRRAGLPVLAVDVSPDRKWSAVAMCAARGDGLPMVQVVRHGDGMAWVVKHVGAVVRGKGVRKVAIDGVGPGSNLQVVLEAELKGSGAELVVMNTGEVCDAYATMYDSVVTEQVRHLGQAELNDSVDAATTRMIGDRKALNRRGPADDITSVVAAANALWLHGQGPGESKYERDGMTTL